MAKEEPEDRTSAQLHEKQQETLFVPPTSVETVKDQVITASLMRAVMGISENKGVEQGKKLKSSIEMPEDDLSEMAICFRDSIIPQLKAPNTGAQKKSPSILSMIPLVPALAQVSGLVRNVEGAWNPGEYIKNMLSRGSDSAEKANEIWDLLAITFKVKSSSGSSDKWAEVLEEKLTEIFHDCIEPWDVNVKGPKDPSPFKLQTPAFPARSFVEDLPAVLKLEPRITRRQWYSILDSFLRLSLVSDLLWVGAINKALESELTLCFEESHEIPAESQIGPTLLPQSKFNPIRLGEHGNTTLKNLTREYIEGRLFLKFLLEILEEKGIDLGEINLNDPAGIRNLLELVKENADPKWLEEVKRRRSDVFNKEPDLMQVKKSGSIAMQYYWCCEHSLRQRHTSDPNERDFDQGYWLKKSGVSKNAPWLFELGPVSLLLFAHIACADGANFVTASDFRRALHRYGVSITETDLTSGDIGNSMRSLGLVLDSPDAEGGMMIKSPFVAFEH